MRGITESRNSGNQWMGIWVTGWIEGGKEAEKRER